MKNYYTALILVAVDVVLFVVQLSVPGFTDSFLLISSDTFSRPWILVTSMFLHGSVSHLIGNMFALGLFGLILEHNIGSKRFIIIYFVTGVIASFASIFFYDSALGASGAIFGVLGALAAIRPKMIVWTYGVPMPMFVAAGFWVLLDLIGVFSPSNVANIAHIAGLAAGVVIGIALRSPEVKETKEKILNEEEFNQWEDEWM